MLDCSCGTISIIKLNSNSRGLESDCEWYSHPQQQSGFLNERVSLLPTLDTLPNTRSLQKMSCQPHRARANGQPCPRRTSLPIKTHAVRHQLQFCLTLPVSHISSLSPPLRLSAGDSSFDRRFTDEVKST